MIPTIIGYMNQKVVIDKIRADVSAAGMDPDMVVNFEIQPICEEGILLLNEWVSAQRAYNDMAVKCEALERENNTLRGLKQPLPSISGDSRASAVRETVHA